MTVEEATAHVGGWVRVLNDNNQWSGARVESVTGKNASVRFVGGSKAHVVGVEKMQPWKARNAQVGFTPKAVPVAAQAKAMQPVVIKADASPAVVGGVIEPVAAMIERMGSLEKELDDLMALVAICKTDYDGATQAEAAARAALVEVRKDIKGRLGL